MMAIALILAAALAVAPSDEGLFPFVIRPDAADTVTDMSGLLPKPAGKNGFLRRDGEHFVDARGNVVRLNGMNLTARGNFPTHAEADRLALHFARLGINCLRLHYFDTVGYANCFQPLQPCLFKKDASGRATIVDEEMRDRLEYMIAAFKRNGVYINMNLHVAHELGPADGIRKTCWANRGVDFFVRELIDAEKAYARDLLAHVNPHTGLALADDPTMALVEINNENALMQVYWSQTLQKEGADPWYLAEFHRLREAAGYANTTNGINKFIIETEKRYFREMTAFLKDEIGVKCPVYGTQQDYTAAWVMADTGEVVDSHIYWTHPGWENPKGTDGRVGRLVPDVKWHFINKSLVAAGLNNGGNVENSIARRGGRRVTGLPFVTSECAAPYPNWYGAEYQPMLHAYAAFQDWAGVFAYSWNNASTAFPDCSEYFFSYSSRTDCLAHFPAACAMFLRGDVARANRRLDVAVDVDARLANNRGGYTPLAVIDPESASNGKVPNAVFLKHAVGVDLRKGPVPESAAVACATNGMIVCDTDEITLHRAEGERGFFSVSVRNVKYLSGYVSGKRFDLDGVVFAPGTTKLGWCAVSLTSQKGDGIRAGSRLLLAATGYTHNGGAVFHRQGDFKWGGVAAELGTGKVVTEGVPLAVTLPVGAAKCWALDETGTRTGAVPVAVRDGLATVAVGPEYKTVWYEIQL